MLAFHIFFQNSWCLYWGTCFVTKKKIGTAVKRNKIRRRLKSAVQKIIKNSKSVNLNYSYVIFGKADVYNDKFSYIYDEVSNVFNKIKNFKN